jgi:hypothetical protein
MPWWDGGALCTPGHMKVVIYGTLYIAKKRGPAI